MSNDLRGTVFDLIKQFSGQKQVLTIPRLYIAMTGDHLEALLLSQIVYWSARTKNPDGWFYKSYQEWDEELGMSQYQVKRAATALREFGVETKLKKADGAPTLHYRIDGTTFINSIIEFLNNGKSRNSINLDSEETSQSITRDYQEITTDSGDTAPEDAPPEKTLTPHRAMVAALMEVCQFPIESMRGKYNKASKILRDGGRTPEDVARFGEIYYRRAKREGWSAIPTYPDPLIVAKYIIWIDEDERPDEPGEIRNVLLEMMEDVS